MFGSISLPHVFSFQLSPAQIAAARAKLGVQPEVTSGALNSDAGAATWSLDGETVTVTVTGLGPKYEHLPAFLIERGIKEKFQG